MNWFSMHLSETLVIIGLVLLGIEILVLGFATFILFFVGLASIITAGLMWLGLIPETYLSALLSVAILTAIDALILWKPLKQMQQHVDTKVATSDLIGHQFVLDADVSSREHPDYSYSGINWKLTSQVPIAAGSKVKVVAVSVGQMEVSAAD